MVQLKTTEYIWIDGNFVKWKDAKVHVMTHALHYGSAVFEGIRSYENENGPAIFRLGEHLDRLFYSAQALGMEIEFTKEQLKNAIKKLLVLNKLKDAYIRPLVYYGYGNIAVYPKNVPSRAAIIALPEYDSDSKNLNIMVSNYIRPSEGATIFGAKISGNYVSSILAMHEARKKGYDEALMLDNEGFISEGPTENLFLVKNGKVITPSSRSALHGITMGSIIKITKDMGIDAREKRVTLSDVKKADELFFCGTAKEISPIISVNHKKIGNGKAGKITIKIKNKFYEIVSGKDEKYGKWLTHVDKNFSKL